ncbi:MAG: outer membrane beta-barrel protein [Gemmatimonadaceae bacterium]
MKRTLIALAAVALCVVPMAAQAQGGLGILGGWSYGQVPNSNTSGHGSLSGNSGFALGIGAESGGPLGFGINALYAQRGFRSNMIGNSQELSYIDVPVYFRVAIQNPVVTPFALIGPQVAFELHCNANGTDCPSGRDKTTFDGIAAIGVKFPMLSGLSIQGRYLYALKDLNYGTVSNQSNYRQRSFMLLLGIGF